MSSTLSHPPALHVLRAYGLTFRSELPLVGGDVGQDVKPDDSTVDVTFGQVRLEAVSVRDEGCAVWAEPGGDAKLSYDGVGAFRVTGGRRVVVDPAPGVDARELQFFLLGPALSVLLA